MTKRWITLASLRARPIAFGSPGDLAFVIRVGRSMPPVPAGR